MPVWSSTEGQDAHFGAMIRGFLDRIWNTFSLPSVDICIYGECSSYANPAHPHIDRLPERPIGELFMGEFGVRVLGLLGGTLLV
jgi:hypothetical protein